MVDEPADTKDLWDVGCWLARGECGTCSSGPGGAPRLTTTKDMYAQ